MSVCMCFHEPTYLLICPSVHLHACMSIRTFIHLSVSLYIHMSICISLISFTIYSYSAVISGNPAYSDEFDRSCVRQ